MQLDSAQKPERFITKQDVADLVGRTIRTVDRWAELGLLPSYRVIRGRMFKRSEVDISLGKLLGYDRLRISLKQISPRHGAARKRKNTKPTKPKKGKSQ